MSIGDNHVSVMNSTSRLRSVMREMMRGILLRTEREFTRAACRSGVLILWSRWVGAKDFGKGEFEDTEGEREERDRLIVGRIN